MNPNVHIIQSTSKGFYFEMPHQIDLILSGCQAEVMGYQSEVEWYSNNRFFFFYVNL